MFYIFAKLLNFKFSRRWGRSYICFCFLSVVRSFGSSMWRKSSFASCSYFVGIGRSILVEFSDDREYFYLLIHQNLTSFSKRNCLKVSYNVCNLESETTLTNLSHSVMLKSKGQSCSLSTWFCNIMYWSLRKYWFIALCGFYLKNTKKKKSHSLIPSPISSEKSRKLSSAEWWIQVSWNPNFSLQSWNLTWQKYCQVHFIYFQ